MGRSFAGIVLGAIVGIHVFIVLQSDAARGIEPLRIEPLRPKVAERQVLLRSERGSDSEITLLQLNAGPEVQYLLAVRTANRSLARVSRGLLFATFNDVRSASVANERKHAVREWLWPTGDLVPTDIVYDCTRRCCTAKRNRSCAI